MDKQLEEWTGERLETFVFNENTIEHLHRYAIASALCKSMDVLDIASGEGYGSNLLSLIANKVTGVDISNEAVNAAAKKYKRNNLTFKEGSATNIPLNNASVDTVVSFETIEHHDKHEEMLIEIKRVLKPGGLLIMSSPDKKYYTDVPAHFNPFHVKELYFNEFKALINAHFKNAIFYFQKVITGSLIIPEPQHSGFKEYNGNYNGFEETEGLSALFNVCIASDKELPTIGSSLFDGTKVFEKIILDRVADAEQLVRDTKTYQLGQMLLSPFKMFKRNN